MLIPQSQSEPAGTQGRPRTDFAELRRQLANPSSLNEGSRQRLLDLARRLARIRALGDEYTRVDLSDWATETLLNSAMA